jgi:hypothetical protein
MAVEQALRQKSARCSRRRLLIVLEPATVQRLT